MEVSAQFVVLVPIVMALVSIAKNVGLPNQYAPLVAILFGAIGTVGLAVFDFPTVLNGIVVGLTASGLYSGVKTTVKG